GTDARQARMVRQGLVQVIAEKPPDTQPVGGEAHQLAFGANALEEHYELQAKEDARIDAWPPCASRIAVPNEVAHDREIEHAVEVAVAVVGRDQLVQGERRDRGEDACFRAHHMTTSSVPQRLLDLSPDEHEARLFRLPALSRSPCRRMDRAALCSLCR